MRFLAPYPKVVVSCFVASELNMASIKVGVPAQEVLQGAGHVLFVEGEPDGFDVTVLRELLPGKVRVEPLGSCYSVRSVATSLHKTHRTYWFLIDRDDWDDESVERSWKNFPDPNADNLLIWRRRELESYFLEPDWVVHSRYLRDSCTANELAEWLEKEAGRTIWLDAANRVIEQSRRVVKGFECELLQYKDVIGCDRDEVGEHLAAWRGRIDLAGVAAREAEPTTVLSAFHRECEYLTGGRWPLELGTGLWRDRIRAKEHFRNMVNQWFVVPDQARGGSARLTGRKAERAVAVDLPKNHQNTMPLDLRELRQLLDGQT